MSVCVKSNFTHTDITLQTNCVSEFNNWIVSSKTSLGVRARHDTTVVLIPSNRSLVVVFDQCFAEFKIIY